MNKPLFCLFILIGGVYPCVFGVSPHIVVDGITVEFDGVGSPRSVEDSLGFAKGDRVTEDVLASAVERVGESGRFEAVEYDLLPGRNGRTEVLVRVIVDPGYRPEAGERVRIDGIDITGNRKTKDSVILSEFLFEPGDEVDLAVIEESVQMVFNRELFFETDWGLYDEPGGVVMELRVREKWTLFPVIYVIGDDGQTQLNLGAIDLNFAGQGFMLLGNYIGTFYPDDPAKHNFNFVYNHQKLAGSPWGLLASGGYLSELAFVSEQGVRVGEYESDDGFIRSWLSYSWTPQWKTSLLTSYHHDVLSGDYDATVNAVGVGFRFAYDDVDLYDLRKSGFGARAELSGIFPFTGGFGTYIEAGVQVRYNLVFFRDLLNITTRLRADYSSAELLPYRTNRFIHLRGGSGREYYSPLVLSANGEFGIAPLRENWMFLELVGVADLSWGDDGTGFMYRVGPGFRISFPPLAGLSLNLDYVFTERGESELYFGMFRFIDAR